MFGKGYWIYWKYFFKNAEVLNVLSAVKKWPAISEIGQMYIAEEKTHIVKREENIANVQ